MATKIVTFRVEVEETIPDDRIRFVVWQAMDQTRIKAVFVNDAGPPSAPKPTAAEKVHAEIEERAEKGKVEKPAAKRASGKDKG